MGLSIRAYARHRGVSHVAVKKAIDTGRITQGADGTIDPDRADREWEQNTETPKRGNARDRSMAQGKEDVAVTEPPRLPAGGTTLIQARTVNEVLKAKIRTLELAQKKEESVERAPAIAHVYAMARAERESWLNWPNRVVAQMAAALNVHEHTLHVTLDAAVRAHLDELGTLTPRVN